MTGLVLLIVVYLTFMLTANLWLYGLTAKVSDRLSTVLKKHNLQIWFWTIVVVGLIGMDSFHVVLPEQTITMSFELLIVLVVMLPFILASGYKPEKSFRGFYTFCLVFPIAEEILFRGIILSLLTNLVGANSVRVPVPILREVTLQVFVSAICFGITHFQYFGFQLNRDTAKKVTFAFIFGLFAGNLVEITGSIMYPVIFHIFANCGTALFYMTNAKANEAVSIER